MRDSPTAIFDWAIYTSFVRVSHFLLCCQRTGLCIGRAFELSLPTTVVDVCKNVKNIFISQIEFRKARIEAQ